MEIKLFKKPKGVTIVTGFPGFGLVGTIATEFLLDHLDAEQIGKIWMDQLPAMIAVHEGKLVEPLGIFYHKRKNLVIIHGVTAIKGLEWKIADAVMKIALELKATEILCLEGVGSLQKTKEPNVFYFANRKETKRMLKKADCKDLNEGIIMGVTGSILIRADKMDKACIFAETQSNLPDSNAAAKVVQVLDKYLGLKVDYKPLIQQAAKFEEKLKGIMQKGNDAEKMQQMKNLSYMG
jgi:uncharacterized protein